jgi:serine/threonine protein kinase
MEAKDLIGLLLQKDSNNRLTAEEALEHPWFQTKFPDHGKPRLVRQTQEKLGIVDQLNVQATMTLGGDDDYH